MIQSPLKVEEVPLDLHKAMDTLGESLDLRMVVLIYKGLNIRQKFKILWEDVTSSPLSSSPRVLDPLGL